MKLMKDVDLDERTSFLDQVYLANSTNILWDNTKTCSNHVFLLGQQKIPEWDKHQAKTGAWSYHMEGHAENAWKGFVNWQTKRQNKRKKIKSLLK